jgi:hypothetical protein
MKIKLLAALILATGLSWSQPVPGAPVVIGSRTVGAACKAGSPMYANLQTGALVSCQGGTWQAVAGGGGGTGNVVGPASATDGHLAVFDTTTGKLLKDGGAVPAASITTMSTGEGAPSAACAVPSASNLALYWDRTNRSMYYCSNNTGPVWQKFSTDGAGSGKTGATQWGGMTSGGAGFTVNDVAGTSILYILPAANGAAGQVLYDTGAATCPTLETAPTSCHQLAWTGSTRTITFLIPGDGTAGAMQDTEDYAHVWKNGLPATFTITAVSCIATGSGTTRVQLTNDGNAILTDNTNAGLDCTSTEAPGALHGTNKAIATTKWLGYATVSAGTGNTDVAISITGTVPVI